MLASPRRGIGQGGTRLRGFLEAVLLGLVVIGVWLRLVQFFAHTSLWMDEITLSRNILDRSMWPLLSKPLDYFQVAPKGFLFVEKLASVWVGPRDYALRLFPLCSSLVALVAFWRFVRRWLPPLAASIALVLFSTAAALIVFGSEVKQYSTDVAAAVLLLWLAFDLAGREISVQLALRAGLAGALLMWFSQAAVLMAFGLACSLAAFVWADQKPPKNRRLRSWACLLGIWGISALCATYVGFKSMTGPTLTFMRQYWAAGLLPTPSWQALHTLWPLRQLLELLATGGQASLGYPHPKVYLALIITSFWPLWKRLGQRAFLLFAPIGVAIAAAVAREYPFSDRLILFLLPIFFVAIAATIQWIFEWLTSWSRYAGWLAVVLLLGPAISPVIAMPPPYRVEDIKPVLSHVRSNWRAGDTLYVFHGAIRGFTFYSGDYGFLDRDYVIGGFYSGSNRRYLQELDVFRQRPRVWILITHAFPWNREEQDIVQYLDTIGVRRDALSVPSRVVGRWAVPAQVFLYDLSNPRRLSAATAASIPLGGAAQDK